MNIAIIGNGKIGSTVAKMLRKANEYNVFVADSIPFEEVKQLDVANEKDLANWLTTIQATAVICTTPYFLIKPIAKVCKHLNLAYFDLTEDRKSNDFVKSLDLSFCMTQCGLAPGVVSVKAMDLIRQFDEVEDVEMRVGALPLYTNNEMQYYFTWSTIGMINQISNLCDAIYEGKRMNLVPLEGYEKITIDGSTYEAFNTSGGIGSLCDTMEGKVNNLNYKSMRYQGNHAFMKFLLKDLNLGKNKEVFEKIFNKEIPQIEKDVVLIYVRVVGKKDNKLQEKTYFKKIYSNDEFTAIQLTTASALCAAITYWQENDAHGNFRQEDIPWKDFTKNNFGQLFM